MADVTGKEQTDNMQDEPEGKTAEDFGKEKNGDSREPEEQKKDSGERKPWDIRPYLAVGLTTVLVIFVALALFFFFYRFNGFAGGVGKAIKSVYGVIFGLILAYLLNPVMKFFERILKKHMFTKGERTYRQNRVIRGLSVTFAMVCFLAVIAILITLMAPSLISSIRDLLLTLNDKLATLEEWIDRLIRNNAVEGQAENIANQIFDWLQSWLQERVLDSGSDIITTLTTGVYSLVKMIINIIVGLFVAVYVLMTKERFLGQVKKIIYAIFKPRAGNVIMETLQQANDVFGGFFIGKIIDSLIIGFICFVVLSIMNMPYTVLVSVIVGVTNIIPVFGPYIGAVPSALLIFLVSPIQALYFIIFIIILQQVDGQLLGPKILGSTTGLTPFWIIFAILLFGGSFGIVGMIFGVPIFAVIYYIIKRIAEYFLGRKGLPRQTKNYIRLNRVNVDTNQIEESDEDRRVIIEALKRSRRKQPENKE
ncbi:MAG: AI-2E family transporter [Clostridiales bacterium]|nr:AI-2E family transporter [Clostridiales bacterium]